MLIFAGAVVYSWSSGDRAPANPFGSKSLEWQTPTPVPLENFAVLPVISERPYTYGVPDPYENVSLNSERKPDAQRVGGSP